MKGRHLDRYYRDDSGKWWCRVHSGRRVRALLKNCIQCKDEFIGIDARQSYCGHKCAATDRHARAPKTTVASLLLGPELRNSDNPRYTKDETGQWWYKPIGRKDHGRTRATIKICSECGCSYLSNVFHKVKQTFCSRSCGVKASHKANPGRMKGSSGSNWKGGRMLDRRGYVLAWAPDHPSPRKVGGRYMFEHRLVMEHKLGRLLLDHETVHHKNGIRSDNSEDNLELWSRSQPPGQRVEDKIAWATQLLSMYGISVSSAANE